jgi:hypothetical protein
VLIAPGLIELHRIPYGPSSSAMFFIRPYDTMHRRCVSA